jgi:hypothetical protein
MVKNLSLEHLEIRWVTGYIGRVVRRFIMEFDGDTRKATVPSRVGGHSLAHRIFLCCHGSTLALGDA